MDPNFHGDPMAKTMAHRDRQETKRHHRATEMRGNIAIAISVISLLVSLFAVFWRG